MKTMYEALRGGGEQGPRRAWIGHRALQFMAVVMLVSMWTDFLNDGFQRRLFSTPSVLLMVFLLWQGMRHDVRLCEQCVAEFPLDGSGKAERRRPLLRLFHLAGDPAPWGWWHRIFLVLFTPGMLALLAIGPAAGFLLPSHGWVWRVLSDIPVTMTALLVMWSARNHSRLVVWCPWCRDGGGGIVEPSPDPMIPEPAPAGTA